MTTLTQKQQTQKELLESKGIIVNTINKKDGTIKLQTQAQTFTLETIKKQLISNSYEKPNNKASNELFINLINIINQPKNKIEIITSNLNTATLNKGVIGECLVKMLLNKSNFEAWKSNGYDLKINNIDIEIKTSTSKGYAHYCKSQNLDIMLFLDQKGLYLTNGTKNAILDKCKKHIQTINKNNSIELLNIKDFISNNKTINDFDYNYFLSSLYNLIDNNKNE